MKAYATFRRPPLSEVVPRSNQDRHPLEVVPYGNFGAGVWTGHPVEFVVVMEILIVGLMGIPAWRWFLGATLLVGGLLGYLLWRRDSLCAALSGERSRAQDAVHQVFLKLLENRALRDATDAKAYLFTCVRNAVLNDRKARQRDVELDAGSAWFEPPNRDYAAELALRRALWSLPEDQRVQREVTILHIGGEFTFSQIAEVLRISANTAASRYRYALAKLREAMRAEEDCRANSR